MNLYQNAIPSAQNFTTPIILFSQNHQSVRLAQDVKKKGDGAS